MDYDVSISIGTTANLGGVDKATKAVEDMGKAIDKLPPQLLPGGVGGKGGSSTGTGGPATPTYVGTPPSGSGMTWRLVGMEDLTTSLGQTNEAVKQVDKTITITSQRLDKNSGWLSRSINALASLPGKIQSWGGNTMQSFGKFNGGIQNLTNMVNLGKQAWDLGWSIGESLNEAFGVKAKQIDSKVAAIIQAAQDKLARWQDNLEAARAKHREDAFLKQEAAGVKQVNDAYAARLRTIEAIDRKAMAGLEHQQKLLQIENEKNRHIIQERKIRGEISDAQARDMLAMIDAKDANERMEIERKQAEQAVATSQAKADAAEERYNKLMALSKSGIARQAVTDLKPMEIRNQADAAKRAEEDLARWRSIRKRQQDAQKEIQQAIKDQAAAATMAPLVGAPIALARKQMEDQARQDYDAAVAAQHEFMRDKGMSFNETDKGNEDILKKIVEQRRSALDNMLGRIDKTGLIGNLDGKNDNERLDEYVRVLQLVQSVIKEDSTRLEEIYLETTAIKQQANEAKERLQTLLKEQQSQKAANEAMAQETAKTNVQQDAGKHAEVMAGAMEDNLRKQIDELRRNQEDEKEKLNKANERLNANMTTVRGYADKAGDTRTGHDLNKLLEVYNNLSAKPKDSWSKLETKEYEEQIKKFKELSSDSNLANKSEKYKDMVAATMRALEAWKSAMEKDAQIKKDDKTIRELERAAQDVSGLTGKLRDGKSKVLALDDWIAKMRRDILSASRKAGDVGRDTGIGSLPDAEILLRKVLSEQGDGGTKITRGERDLLDKLRARLESDPRRLEAGNEFQQLIEFIDTLLNKYSAQQRLQTKVAGDVARLQARLDKIESQGKFGPRK